MRFYTTQHPFYCGSALHARTMYVCIRDQSGAVLGHRNMKTDPETFLHVVAPYRQGMVGAVACMFPWDWRADLWADAGLPCVLGQALSMTALHGGKATNDTRDSHTSAPRLRGGRLPQAYGYPAQRRATRALLRRRLPLAPKRAEFLAHVQHTNRQYTLLALGKKIVDKANREVGGRARCRGGRPKKYRGRSGAPSLRRCVASRCRTPPRPHRQAP